VRRTRLVSLKRDLVRNARWRAWGAGKVYRIQSRFPPPAFYEPSPIGGGVGHFFSFFATSPPYILLEIVMDNYCDDDRIAHVKALRHKYRTKSLGGFDGTLFQTAYRAARAEEREMLTKTLNTQAKTVGMLTKSMNRMVATVNKSLGAVTERLPHEDQHECHCGGQCQTCKDDVCDKLKSQLAEVDQYLRTVYTQLDLATGMNALNKHMSMAAGQNLPLPDATLWLKKSLRQGEDLRKSICDELCRTCGICNLNQF
jgi:hypothetical protein